MKQQAPKVFRAKFETSQGDFIFEVHRDWSPNGADRFYNLVRNGFYNECRFFRIIDNFMAQIGISGDPKLAALWRTAQIPDDPVKESNKRGYVSFATSGPNTRTTQFFINFKDNSRLDGMGFSPFGKVIEGMDVVDDLYAGYGEGAPRGRGPEQGRIQKEGNTYLKKEFPKLDYVEKAIIVEGKPATPPKK
ncbi:MAG: peptidylprolyl isomerase [Candidatus Eisenbacteria sp.]|nr:peptidylprolyl isomerase [Candidatus Eisenbacteria bacterium]